METLGERLLEAEERRLKNQGIRMDWLQQFGELYFRLEEQLHRLRKLEAMGSIEGVTWTEAEKRVAEDMAAEARDLRLLEADVNSAKRYLYEELARPGTMAEEEIVSYLERARKVLVKLWLMVDPDRLELDERFHNLHQDQQRELGEIRQRVQVIRLSHFNYRPGQIGHRYPSLTMLLAELRRAETILEHGEVAMDTSLIIRGDTVEEKLQWLGEQIPVLERNVELAEELIFDLESDDDVRRMKAQLAAAWKSETIRERFLARVEEEKQRADELEEELRRELPGGDTTTPPGENDAPSEDENELPDESGPEYP